MERVVLNSEWQNRLNSRAELVDNSGKLVGFFVPAAEYCREAIERANWAFDHESLDETRKETSETGVVTTSDMLAAVARLRAIYEARAGHSKSTGATISSL